MTIRVRNYVLILNITGKLHKNKIKYYGNKIIGKRTKLKMEQIKIFQKFWRKWTTKVVCCGVLINQLSLLNLD